MAEVKPIVKKAIEKSVTAMNTRAVWAGHLQLNELQKKNVAKIIEALQKDDALDKMDLLLAGQDKFGVSTTSPIMLETLEKLADQLSQGVTSEIENQVAKIVLEKYAETEMTDEQVNAELENVVKQLASADIDVFIDTEKHNDKTLSETIKEVTSSKIKGSKEHHKQLGDSIEALKEKYRDARNAYLKQLVGDVEYTAFETEDKELKEAWDALLELDLELKAKPMSLTSSIFVKLNNDYNNMLLFSQEAQQEFAQILALEGNVNGIMDDYNKHKDAMKSADVIEPVTSSIATFQKMEETSKSLCTFFVTSLGIDDVKYNLTDMQKELNINEEYFNEKVESYCKGKYVADDSTKDPLTLATMSSKQKHDFVTNLFYDILVNQSEKESQNLITHLYTKTRSLFSTKNSDPLNKQFANIQKIMNSQIGKSRALKEALKKNILEMVRGRVFTKEESEQLVELAKPLMTEKELNLTTELTVQYQQDNTQDVELGDWSVKSNVLQEWYKKHKQKNSSLRKMSSWFGDKATFFLKSSLYNERLDNKLKRQHQAEYDQKLETIKEAEKTTFNTMEKLGTKEEFSIIPDNDMRLFYFYDGMTYTEAKTLILTDLSKVADKSEFVFKMNLLSTLSRFSHADKYIKKEINAQVMNAQSILTPDQIEALADNLKMAVKDGKVDQLEFDNKVKLLQVLAASNENCANVYKQFEKIDAKKKLIYDNAVKRIKELKDDPGIYFNFEEELKNLMMASGEEIVVDGYVVDFKQYVGLMGQLWEEKFATMPADQRKDDKNFSEQVLFDAGVALRDQKAMLSIDKLEDILKLLMEECHSTKEEDIIKLLQEKIANAESIEDNIKKNTEKSKWNLYLRKLKNLTTEEKIKLHGDIRYQYKETEVTTINQFVQSIMQNLGREIVVNNQAKTYEMTVAGLLEYIKDQEKAGNNYGVFATQLKAMKPEDVLNIMKLYNAKVKIGDIVVEAEEETEASED